MRLLTYLLAVGMVAALNVPAAWGAPYNRQTHDNWHSSFADDAYYRQGDAELEHGPTLDYASSGYQCCQPTCSCTQAPCGACCDCGPACNVGCGAAAGPAGLLSSCHCCLVRGARDLSLARLMGLSRDSQIEIGGWTEVVYMDNNVPLSTAYNDLRSFDDVPDRIQLGQQWFYLGRTVDGSAGLDLGGRLDLVYGTDAQKTQAFGNPRSDGANGERRTGTWDASLDHGAYGFAIPQAFVELGAGELAVKVGHFFTPIGYEVIPATGNFFRSHSYTMFNSEPFTHTGALATWTGVEGLTLYGGWSLGWDTGFDQLNSGNCLISGFGYELNDSITFTYLNTYGNFGLVDAGSDNSYSHSCVLIVDLTKRLQYIGQSDLLAIDNPGVVETDTIGLNQYLIYSFNDWLGIGGRVEWWKKDGVSYYEATGGLNAYVLDNLLIRPEYRQDWSPGGGIDSDSFLIDAILSY